jgi:ABC-type transport system involved in multi-copper enzyme maturation permease subunit
MFFLLVRKELLEHLLSLRFALACLICLVIVVSSSFVLGKDYKEALSDYHTNVTMHKNEVEESNDLVWGGIKIDRPLNPMQIFFRGVDRELTATAKVNGVGDPQFEARYEGNPVVFLFPSIDLLFFIGVVMSLLAIAFSYDAVAGEKELGTLKLLMSYSLPRDRVLLAKWTGGYLVLITPLLLALLCGLLVVMLFPTVELQADHWTELGLILLVALCYLGAIYSLGLFVSTRTPLASTSITVLLVVWVLVVLVVPNIAPYLAAQIAPLRSATAIDREKFRIEREENQKFEELMRRWEEEHPDARQGGGEWWVYWDVAKKDQILRLVDHQQKIDDQFQKRMDAQIRLAKQLSRISPLASFAYAATELAGTGIRNRNRFMEMLPDYRKRITVFGLDRWVLYDGGEVEGEYNIEGYPQFVYGESRLQDRIGGIFADILMLGIWNIVFFMGAYLSFLRYDMT